MSSSFPERDYMKNCRYSGDFKIVPVDTSGFYEKGIAMEELCYCVGVASIQEDGIYAAHISPGEVGIRPEEMMDGFEEGEETYIVAGVRSQDYDSTTFDHIISELDGEFQVFTASEFALNEEGEIFEGFEKKSIGSSLTSNV